jgi:WD40 repeat protein
MIRLAGVGLLAQKHALKHFSLAASLFVLLACLLVLTPRHSLAWTEGETAPPTLSKVAKGQDAESFLTNPTPLQGDALSVGGLAFSPDGKILAMGAGWAEQMVGQVRLWDVDKGQMIATLKTGRPVRSVAFSADGKHLATAESMVQSSCAISKAGQFVPLSAGIRRA